MCNITMKLTFVSLTFAQLQNFMYLCTNKRKKYREKNKEE